MLKTRLISAAVMVPLVIAGILYLPTEAIAVLLALLMGVGLWEWSRMIPLQSALARFFYPAGVLALMWLVWAVPLEQAILPLLLAAFFWWLGALYWLSRHGSGAAAGGAVRLLKAVAGVLVMLPAWAALLVLHARDNDGPLLCLFLLVVVWLADSGAYFSGKRWGRTKLAPGISPGKTWEGVYGAVIVSGLFTLVAGLLYSHSVIWTIGLVLAALLAVLFSIEGDLFESLMKRQSGLKDSSHLIPGHGGVLDRIDSLTAAAPVFLLAFHWLKL